MNGEIAIGAGETQFMRMLAEHIKRFSLDYPQGHLQKFHSADANETKDRANKGLLDICLLTEPVDVEKFDFLRIPQKERWGVLMRKDSPLAQKRKSIRMTLPYPILVAGRSIVRNELANWFGDAYDRMNIIGS